MRSSNDPGVQERINKIVLLSMYKRVIELCSAHLPAAFLQKKFKSPRLLLMAAIKEILHSAITVPDYMLRGNKLSFTVKITNNPEFFDFMIYCINYNNIIRGVNDPNVVNLFGDTGDVPTRTVLNSPLRLKYLYNGSYYLHEDTPKDEILTNIAFNDHPLNLNLETIRTDISAVFVLFDIFKEHYEEVRPTLEYFKKLSYHWNRLHDIYYSATSNNTFDATFFQYVDFVLSRQNTWDYNRCQFFLTEFEQWREQVRTGNLDAEAIFGPSAIVAPITPDVELVTETPADEGDNWFTDLETVSSNNIAASQVHANIGPIIPGIITNVINSSASRVHVSNNRPNVYIPTFEEFTATQSAEHIDLNIRLNEEIEPETVAVINPYPSFTMNLVEEPENPFTLIRRR